MTFCFDPLELVAATSSVLVSVYLRHGWWEKDGEGVVGPSRVGFRASEERGMAELSVLHRFSSRKDEPQGSPANHLSSGHHFSARWASALFLFLSLSLSPSRSLSLFSTLVARLIVADSLARELDNLWRLWWIGRFVNTSRYFVRLGRLIVRDRQRAEFCQTKGRF